MIPDYSAPGPYVPDNYTYAAGPSPSGQTYSSQGFSDYVIFDKLLVHIADFTTRRIDITDFFDTGWYTVWPFGPGEAPLNGFISLPSTGTGPFPLFIIAHGNASIYLNSAEGYAQLCSHLASHGFLAATIDVGFLNETPTGEDPARAIVQLEHVKQIQTWNQTPGHPLYGKWNGQLILAGHSRGGEGATIAAFFNPLSSVQVVLGGATIPLDGTGANPLGPYAFNVQAIVAMAPSDGVYIPPTGQYSVQTNYMVMQGSIDSDEWAFPGYKTFDRAFRPDPMAPVRLTAGSKALVYIHGGCHAYFNDKWPLDENLVVPDVPKLISRDDQKRVAKGYLTAFVLGLVASDVLAVESLKLTLHQTSAAPWIPSGVYVTTQFQNRYRDFIQNFEEGDPPVISPPLNGIASLSVGTGLTVLVKSFDDGMSSPLYEETEGLRVQWAAGAAASTYTYEITFPAGSINTAVWNLFALRAGMSTEPENPATAPVSPQGYDLTVTDGTNTFGPVAQCGCGPLIYPDGITASPWTSPIDLRRVVMQSNWIVFNDINTYRVDLNKQITLTISFSRVPTGVLYLDDLQFSE